MPGRRLPPWGERGEAPPLLYPERLGRRLPAPGASQRAGFPAQIFDSANERYEVPVPLSLPPAPEGSAASRLYDVAVQSKPFGIQVRRRSTGTVM